MKKKITSFLLLGCLLIGGTVGCTGSKYKIVKVDEVGNEVDEPQVTTQVEITSENSTEPEIDSTEDSSEDTEYTEESNVNSENLNLDYVGESGLGFNCSETLSVISDSETYTNWSWDRTDAMLDITTEVSSMSFSEEKDIVKDVYSDGEILQSEDTVTYGGYNAYLHIIKEPSYGTAILIVDLGDSVVKMKCIFDTEEGLNITKEAIASFGYIPQ